MTRPAFLAFASMVSLSAGGAGVAAAPPNAAFLAARLLADDSAQARVPPTFAATGLASKLRLSRAHPSGSTSPLARVEEARASAMLEPARDFYVGAVQVYPWVEGSLYKLYTAPGQVSDIALEAGEVLVSVAAGDTARWVIGDTTSGAGLGRRTHVLVKPSAAGLSTNLVIATDRRVYHVQLESHVHAAMASISWTYPAEALLALKAPAPSAPEPDVAADVTVEALDFNYRIEGDNPPWRPLRAFDDGRQVFIEFPPKGEAPPLFVRGEDGRAELVNYRLRGRYYVVDRLFGAAELRLGEKHQQVVRIVHDATRPRSGS